MTELLYGERKPSRINLVRTSIHKKLQERYTIPGRLAKEYEKIKDITETLSAQDKQQIELLLQHRIKSAVQRTIIGDILIGSGIIVSGVLLVKNRELITSAIKNLVHKDVDISAEKSPAVWAEILKTQATHMSLGGTLRADTAYTAGDVKFNGKNQGNYYLGGSEQKDVAGEWMITVRDKIQQMHYKRRDAGTIPRIPLSTNTLVVATGMDNAADIAALKRADSLGLLEGQEWRRRANHRHILPTEMGILYRALIDPTHTQNYSHPDGGVDNRMSPFLWQVLVPQKTGKEFIREILRRPNLIDATVRELCRDLFQSFGLTKAEKLLVIEGGNRLSPDRVLGFDRWKLLNFSPPVGDVILPTKISGISTQ